MKIASQHLIAAAGLLAALSLGPALSATAPEPNVGFIDMQRISGEVKAVRNAEQELKTAQDNLRAEFENRRKQLAEAVKKNMSAAEQEKLREQLDNEMGPLRDKYQQLSGELSGKLTKQIDDAVKKVADTRKMTLVLDKQVIRFGGKDITEEVIKQLNG